jgi:hypothetical protein
MPCPPLRKAGSLPPWDRTAERRSASALRPKPLLRRSAPSPNFRRNAEPIIGLWGGAGDGLDRSTKATTCDRDREWAWNCQNLRGNSVIRSEPCVYMRLLVYEPTDCHPRSLAVDGPPGDATLRQAVGGEIEDVPGFNSIWYEGALHRCVAFCNDRGKGLGLPLNAWATALWHSALRHQGYERGLRREDGTVADRLVGNVVIVFEDKASRIVTTLAQSPAIIPTSEPHSRETYSEIDLIGEAERLFK